MTGQKLSKVPPKEQDLKLFKGLDNLRFISSHKFIDQINNVQSSWKAVVYDDYNGMTVRQLMSRAGGQKRFDFPQARSVVIVIVLHSDF